MHFKECWAQRDKDPEELQPSRLLIHPVQRPSPPLFYLTHVGMSKQGCNKLTVLDGPQMRSGCACQSSGHSNRPSGSALHIPQPSHNPSDSACSHLHML